MATRNGRSVFDIITNGFRRTVADLNGNGQPAVSLPSDWVDQHNVEIGDEVAIKPSDDDDRVLELHFGDDE